MKGLIFKEKWANLILNGDKTIDIRGCNTKKNEKIGIIKSGTKKVFGEIYLKESIPLTKELFEATRKKHCWSDTYEDLLKIYKKPYAWIMEDIYLYSHPKEYVHKRGAITWVEL